MRSKKILTKTESKILFYLFDEIKKGVIKRDFLLRNGLDSGGLSKLINNRYLYKIYFEKKG